MNIPASTRIIILSIISILLFSGSLLFAIGTTPDSIKHVTAPQAKALLDKDTTIVVLDVRTEAEFNGQAGRLPRAILIPVQELEKRVKELKPYRSREILVYCRSGIRSMRASSILLKNGFKVTHLDGGIIQWNTAFPPPAEKEKK